jgi:hypothetical protein
VTNNFNKVLVVDRENNKLLVCGSVFQGSCSKYELQNISEEPEFLPEPVAANDARSTTFAFIGPQRYNRWGHGNVLYVVRNPLPLHFNTPELKISKFLKTYFGAVGFFFERSSN